MLTPLDWYEMVLEEYGSLDEFNDIHTVRHALEWTERKLADLEKLTAFAEFLTKVELCDLSDELEALSHLRDELEQWLHQQ